MHSGMTEREAALEGALVANAAIRVQAEQPDRGLCRAGIGPRSHHQLIALFDGRQQRKAERLTAVALSA
jgi:hypothetical protein